VIKAGRNLLLIFKIHQITGNILIGGEFDTPGDD
jgi:hypothetical protein